MSRAIKNELYIEPVFEQISEEFINIDNTKRLITFYVINSDIPTDYNRSDIEELAVYPETEFRTLLGTEPPKLTPPLKLFWDIYSKNQLKHMTLKNFRRNILLRSISYEILGG